MTGRDRMTCAQVRERLPLVPGADLLPAEDVQVRAHLRDCAACRKELGAFVRARRILRGFGSPSHEADGPHDDAFFARLRADTMTAVRRDAAARRRRQRVQAPRRSFAGIMTAAALFLLGVYLVPTWLPEPTRFPTRLEPIRADSPEGVSHDPRFRNVGYGLMGHRLPSPESRVPLGDENADVAPEPAPERDARLLRRLREASHPGRRK